MTSFIDSSEYDFVKLMFRHYNPCVYYHSPASGLNWPTLPHAMASSTAGGSSFAQITPPISETGHTALADHTGASDDSVDGGSTRSKRKRSFVPDDRKDDKYWERRKKNNMAAKKSREMRKKRQDEELQKAETAIQENNKLKSEIEVLKNEVSSLRRLLRDANTTLALWIKARQSSENPLQMSPVLPKPGHAYSFMPYSRAPDNR